MPLPDTTAEPSIDSILQVIARGADLPDAAMRACAVRITEALPTLLGLLDRAGSHGLRREPDRTLVFRAVHILAEARVTAVCRPLLRLLRRPIEEVDDLLGDALTETLPRIVISVFDGDAPALFAAIADRRIDESARWSLLTAAAFLTWDGRIDTKATHDFLRGFGTGRLAPADDVAWIGWGEAIAVLGFTDLAPMVEAVWATMAPEIADLPYFRETLSDAGAEPRDAGRFTANNAGYLDDSVAALDWTRRRVEPAVRDAPRPKPPLATVRAPGRNEACPCGSGRKYKKCCGASA